ncbi:MAG: rhomboid family intramembrane serine protease [Phycisphaerales bacterium]|nr:MAG: rhomboid family intramembrane serine protease [Phycisphaerales bacterium]
MGLYDRDYLRADQRTPRRARVGALPAWSFNTWLIVVNIAIFVVMQLSPPVRNTLLTWGNFNTQEGFFGLEVWRLLTFQFLHSQASLFHILFNMFALWVFGGAVESRMGSKRYAAFYLVCGVFGAIMYLTLNLLGYMLPVSLPGLLIHDMRTPLIGASAGVFGVVMAAAHYQPHAVMQLIFPPISLRLRTLAYIYVGVALANLLLGGANAGGDAAHIGGALAGAYFVRRPHLLHDFFDVFKPPDKKRHAGRVAASKHAPRTPRSTPRGPSQAEVDRVLSKVATEGLHSLSEAERAVLRDATDARRG